MTKFAKINELIVERIGRENGKPIMLSIISANPAIEAESERLAAIQATEAPRGSEQTAYRVMDRRLQALRKAGKIRSTTKGWLIKVDKQYSARSPGRVHTPVRATRTGDARRGGGLPCVRRREQYDQYLDNRCTARLRSGRRQTASLLRSHPQ